MMGGFIALGPIGGMLTDKYGARIFATTGMVIIAISLYLLTLLPYNFNVWTFESIMLLNGIGSGMRATFNNIAQTISMALFFTVAITIFSQDLPSALYNTGISAGLPPILANSLKSIPPSGALFAAFLGINPLAGMTFTGLPASVIKILTSSTFFPSAIGPSFMIGLKDAFYIAIILTLIGAVFSGLRGGKYVHEIHSKEKTVAAQEIDPTNNKDDKK